MKSKLTQFLPLLILAVFLSLRLHASTRGISVSIKDQTGNRFELYENSHALLIGASDYTAGWPDLEAIPGELARVESILLTQGFNVVKVINPDSETLETSFEDFIEKYGYNPNDRLLFFFSGHGYTRLKGKKGYLVPTDAPDPRKDEKGFIRKALSMGQILSWSRDMESKHVLFIFDSCFSGSIFKTKALPKIPPHINALTTEPVRQYITAGSAGEEVPASSVFTPSFVRALEGEADLNEDGYITGTEMGMFLNEKVMGYNSQQTPQYGKIKDPDLDRGDFVFVSPTAKREQVPPVIQESIKTIDAEETLWKAIENSSHIEDFKVYLKTYPAGEFAVTARLKIRQLERKQKSLEPGEESLQTGGIAKKSSLDPVSDSSAFTDPVTGMKFALVKGGCFQMGDTFGDGNSDEQPVHEVCLKDYYLGKYEVTQGQWKQVMNNNPALFKNGDDYPVEKVGWNDIRGFIKELNRQTDGKYRLPTEAEWEYAARNRGEKIKYATQDGKLDRSLVNYGTDKCCAGDDSDGYKYTSPAGTYPPNDLGLYDMTGNVWEWVSDRYRKNYYKKSPKYNPKGPATGTKRVVKGGSWGYDPKDLRCANRHGIGPDNRFFNFGFRLSRSP